MATSGRSSINSRTTVATKYIDKAKMPAPMNPDDLMTHQNVFMGCSAAGFAGPPAADGPPASGLTAAGAAWHKISPSTKSRLRGIEDSFVTGTCLRATQERRPTTAVAMADKQGPKTT